MAGGGDAALQRRTGVWWDLNTCPVPDGFDPRRVRGCIESAVHKQMGHRSKVIIYAMGNLEYISSALLEEIASSGIVLIHAPCGGNDFKNLLREWSQLNPSSMATTVMLISCNYTMVDPYLFRLTGFAAFCVYPKDSRPVTLDQPIGQKVFVKEFVWETLLNDNITCEMMTVNEDEPLCICDICYDTFEICAEFITHLKSEEHIKELSDIVPRDSWYCKPMHFCHACNYPGYDEYNMLLHNQSKDHYRKLDE
ncbi:unnamed protein product, partial [Brassica rapa subsp. narinosa]